MGEDISQDASKDASQCVICTEDLECGAPLFTCPMCKVSSCHMSCIELWFRNKTTCPCCNTMLSWTPLETRIDVGLEPGCATRIHVLTLENERLRSQLQRIQSGLGVLFFSVLSGFTSYFLVQTFL